MQIVLYRCGNRLALIITTLVVMLRFNFPPLYLFQTPEQCTTGTGAPIGLKTATMTAGPLGPVLVQDFVFNDEMAHFDRERIPERVVHAKGAGQGKSPCPSNVCGVNV